MSWLSRYIVGISAAPFFRLGVELTVFTTYEFYFALGRSFHRFGTAPIKEEVRRVAMQKIKEAVARNYGIEVRDIVGPCRVRRYVRPRQVSMYLSRLLTEHSLPSIGKHHGGRDHTTAIHAKKQIERLLISSTDTQRRIADIRAEIEAELLG